MSEMLPLRSHGGSYDSTSLLTYTPNASTSTSYCRATRSRFKRILGYKKKLSRSGRRRQATSRRLASPGEPRVARTRLILCKICIIKVGGCRKLQATGHQMARPASFEARYLSPRGKAVDPHPRLDPRKDDRTRTSYSEGDHWTLISSRRRARRAF